MVSPAIPGEILSLWNTVNKETINMSKTPVKSSRSPSHLNLNEYIFDLKYLIIILKLEISNQ